MRKVDDGEKKRKKKKRKKKKKIMTFIVATNVIASRLPEGRPTGTPHARANCMTRYNLALITLLKNTSLGALGTLSPFSTCLVGKNPHQNQ